MNTKSNLKVLCILATLVFFATGCGGGSSLMVDGQKATEVPDRQVERMASIASIEESGERVDNLEQLFEYGGNDPVMYNLQGIIMMADGEHSRAADFFREAAEAIKNGEQLYVNSSSNLPDKLAFPARDGHKPGSIHSDDSIVRTLKIYIERDHEFRLVSNLRKWPGELPAPPVYQHSGLNGVALEVINAQTHVEAFKPLLIDYIDKNIDVDRQQMKMLNVVSHNMVTAGLLEGDKDIIAEGKSYFRDIPETLHSRTTRYVVGLGIYMLDEAGWQELVPSRDQAMFSR